MLLAPQPHKPTNPRKDQQKMGRNKPISWLSDMTTLYVRPFVGSRFGDWFIAHRMLSIQASLWPADQRPPGRQPTTKKRLKSLNLSKHNFKHKYATNLKVETTGHFLWWEQRAPFSVAGCSGLGRIEVVKCPPWCWCEQVEPVKGVMAWVNMKPHRPNPASRIQNQNSFT